ncbi:unnamed protein product [Coccothraustes coccothraustes]
MEDPVWKCNHISRAGLEYCSISQACSYTLSNVEESSDNTIKNNEAAPQPGCAGRGDGGTPGGASRRCPCPLQARKTGSVARCSLLRALVTAAPGGREDVRGRPSRLFPRCPSREVPPPPAAAPAPRGGSGAGGGARPQPGACGGGAG